MNKNKFYRMKRSKLIIYLSSFDTKSQREFTQFINSSFFNSPTTACKLWEILAKHAPAFPEDKVNRKKIYPKLFLSQSYNKAKIRYAMSDLTLMVEKYFAYKEFEGCKEKDIFLIKSLNSRNLDKYFLEKIDESRQKLQEEKERGGEYFHKESMLQVCSYEFFSARKNRSEEGSIEKLIDSIDHYYLSQKLYYSCELINRMNILAVNYKSPLLDIMVNFLDQNTLQNTPSIQIYYVILKTLSDNENTTHYLKLKELIKENIGVFNTKELKDIFAFAQNYCIKKANQGKVEFLEELFQLYQMQLSEKINFENGVIPEFDFKNIVTVGLRIGKIEWVDEFIENNFSYLRKDQQVNIYAYNKARLYFAKGEFKNCKKSLHKVEFTDVFYRLDSKTLILKTYFELDDFDSLISLCISLKLIIKRDKRLSPYQKQLYINFAKTVEKLSKIKDGAKINLQKVTEELEKTPVADVGWLREKIKEMKSIKSYRH